MNGLVKQSDTEQQTQKDGPSVTHVTDPKHITMLGTSIADILQAGGIWPPVGTTQKTEPVTASRSAPDVIYSTKGGNGCSVEDLTNMNAAELKKLCEMQDARDRMVWTNSEHWLSVTSLKHNGNWLARLPSLSDQQREKLIYELREKRRQMLASKTTNHSRARIAYRLYALTGCTAYVYGED